MNAPRLAGVVLLVAAVGIVVFLNRAPVDPPAESTPGGQVLPARSPQNDDFFVQPRPSGTPVTSNRDHAEPSVDSPSPIAVTAKAVITLKTLAAEDGALLWWLRVRVLPGGCCGFQHKLDMDNAISLDDQTFVSNGVRVVVLKRQVEMLRGTEVDYVAEHGKQGFKVRNPNFEGEALKKWLPVLNKDLPPSPKLTPGQVAEKLIQYQKLVKDDPQNELAHYRLGQLLMDDGQYAQAVKSFERALELAPDIAKAYQHLGECLAKLGEKDRAVQVLTKGWNLARQRGDEEARNAMADRLSELGVAIAIDVAGRSKKN